MTAQQRIYYQECDGQLLNVYRYDEEEDEINLEIGQIINDPAEHHIEGTPYTTIRRLQ